MPGINKILKGKITLLLSLLPLIAWAVATTIISAGNWNNSAIWSGANIADDITETVSFNNNIGEIIIQNGDSFTTSDVTMNNGNTLTIQSGGVLTIGSATDPHNLITVNTTTLNVAGKLEIWGDLDDYNNLVLTVDGELIIHGNVILKNSASLDVQGNITIEGDFVANDYTTINVDGSLSISGSISVGISSNLTGTGTISVASGCTGPDTFCTSTILDTTPPTITNCPSDFTLYLASNSCEQIANWIEPTATDNIGIADFTSDVLLGSALGIGTTTVTYTATDYAGNTATCSFNIAVQDTISPVFETCPFQITIDAFNPYTQTAIVTWSDPIVTDNCGNVSISSNKNSGDAFPPGLSTIVTTATDNAGNSSVCSVDVDIKGNLVPTGTTPLIVNAYSGEQKEICLDVTDSDGDDLSIIDILTNNINGVVNYDGGLNNLCLNYMSNDYYVGTDIFQVTICDNNTAQACVTIDVQVEVALNLNLTIYKALTPNGDGLNDNWVIENIDNYPNNHVLVFDRWGGVIYEAKGYNNESIVWDGRSMQSGQNTVPIGTYFYKIDLGDGSPAITGNVELVIQ